jgi:peptidoglycan hydrolase-like protein with peptidoglycan-binding domain
MFGKSIRILVPLALSLPMVCGAQDARQILETAQQRQVERWEGVDAYVVDQTVMGNSVSTWFIRTEVQGQDGSKQPFFVPMTQTSVQNRQCDVGLSPEELEAFAAGAEITGDAMATEIEAGMDDAGMPKGMLAATGSDPWNTMDPRVMMGGNAEFLRAAADAKRADKAYDPSRDAQESLNHMQAFMEKARVIGKETVNGRSAWHIRAEGLNHVQEADGGEYRIEAISMYVDTDEYVPLSMKMDGTMIADGESQPMTMNMVQTDYRTVPGSRMYESYRQVMTMSGMLTPEQEAQMAEAQAQLAEFEKQKASMPPQQVAMMESMMGPQLKMIENMAKGGGIEFETVVDNIRVNPALMDAMGNPCPSTGSGAIVAVEVETAPTASGNIHVVETEDPPAPAPTSTSNTVVVTDAPPPPAAAPAAVGDETTLMIQQNLAALGYDVNPSGVADTKTAIAISQYQAENDLPVTGETSPQLAGILAAKASAQNSEPDVSEEELRAAQQACLQEKMDAAQATQQKKRGFGRLLSGVSRLAGQSGNFDLMRTTNDIYQAGATADDFAQAAKDLGLTEDDIAACQNPL